MTDQDNLNKLLYQIKQRINELFFPDNLFERCLKLIPEEKYKLLGPVIKDRINTKNKFDLFYNDNIVFIIKNLVIRNLEFELIFYRFDNKNIYKNISIPRHGQIIIGFYTEEDIEFEIFIGGNLVSRYNLKKNSFVYAINNKYIIPFLSIQFHDISI